MMRNIIVIVTTLMCCLPRLTFGQCPVDDGQVTLCHNGMTKVVSENAAAAHESHGDTCGPCDADGDDVADEVDECPDTLGGESVDAVGCSCDQLDDDGDGTDNCDDLCPDDPDKIGPGECGCGVTDDDDDDADGTPDCNDGCPTDAMKTSEGLCGCDVSDADTDGDGIADCNDGCPEDPDKTKPGVCGCGVPDDDSDDDGIADCVDACPMDANKIAVGDCGCGMTDADSDDDGTADCNDGCPEDPDKIEPGVCGCGAPDDDSDGDGTLDCNDLCPNDSSKIVPSICGCGVAEGCGGGWSYSTDDMDDEDMDDEDMDDEDMDDEDMDDEDMDDEDMDVNVYRTVPDEDCQSVSICLTAYAKTVVVCEVELDDWLVDGNERGACITNDLDEPEAVLQMQPPAPLDPGEFDNLCGIGIGPVGLCAMMMLGFTKLGRRCARAIRNMVMTVAGWVDEARAGKSFDRSKLGKRRDWRWTWTQNVKVKIVFGAEIRELFADTVDVSEGGIGLVLPVPVKKGQVIYLSDDDASWVEGHISHVRKIGGHYCVGIEFKDKENMD